MIKMVIFDMDGTLVDTSHGIYESHKYTLKAMGRMEPSERELEGVIGGPLLSTYVERFRFGEEKAHEAIGLYRKYYSEHGITDVKLYPDMEKTLVALKENGILVGIATLKAEPFAKKIIRTLGIENYFDVVYGMDDMDSRSKADIIKMCMNKYAVLPENAVMIGDSIHDITGAIACKVHTIAVTYGFGFKNQVEALDSGAEQVASNCNILTKLVLKF